MEVENISPSQLIKSILVVLFTLLVVSQALSLYIIQPMAYDGTLARTGRYSLTFEAWSTIGSNENETIVGLGTSLTQYGISGDCIEEKIEFSSTNVYNLGVPGSLPYIEMMQTTTAIANNPSLILLEVNPINLYSLDYASSEYLEMRIKLNSLFMNSADYGDWIELLREQDKTHLDGLFSNRYGSESTYFNSAINEHLTNLLTDESASKHWYLSTPHPSSIEWEDYLKNPVWLPGYLNSLNQSEVEDYENATIIKELKRPRYNPTVEMNLNKLALEYHTFTDISEVDKANADSILVDFQRNEIKYNKWCDGLFWNSSLSLKQFVDAIMHLVFLGITKSTHQMINLWIKLTRRKSIFNTVRN